MMKVLFLTTHLNVGGVSTYIVTLAKYLKAKGVDIVCCSSGGTLVTELKKHNIRHYTLPIKTKNELHFKLVFGLLKLIEIIDTEGITIIHSHTRVAQVLAWCAQKMRPVTCISTCHGFFKRRLFRRFLPAWGDRVIAISDPVREHLVNDFKVQKKKIVLIYNGVEPEKFQVELSSFDKEELRRYYKVGATGLVVGGISRLEKMKGYQNLIRAMVFVLKKYPETKLVLIGDGKYKKKLTLLVKKIKLEKHVYFTGKVEDVGVALQLIDIFVLPAISSEGFGLAVLEAMAAGKPVLASDIGGIYALVKDNINGWLLPSGDIESLGTSIIRLMDDRQLLRQFGKQSRQLAEEKFSMDSMADRVIDVYKEFE